MAAPVPALKYYLLPKVTEQTTGNAAVPYGKVTAEESTYFQKYAWSKIIDTWQEMPLDQLRKEHVPHPTGPLLFLEQGAKCKYCDWQLPIGQVPFYTILLPDAQQSRSFARVLAVTARIEIANGKFDDAIKTLQTNYALGRNVAQGETLINGLVGLAICGIMTPQIMEYVQQPDAPNLFWALTILPNPLIDMQRGIEVESQAMELSFPEVRDLENARHTQEEWREIFQKFANQALEWNTSGPSRGRTKTPDELDKLAKDAFPRAKKALIAAGMAPDKVAAMSVDQVALLYTMRTYHIQFDETAKYFSMPYPQAKKAMDAVIEQSKDPKSPTREIVPVTANSLLALQACRGAIARVDREIAVLRLLEALRIYAAAHEGQLPEKLSEITDVPVPDDPVTGKPFTYRRNGETALLEGETLRETPLSYEITMAASK